MGKCTRISKGSYSHMWFSGGGIWTPCSPSGSAQGITALLTIEYMHFNTWYLHIWWPTHVSSLIRHISSVNHQHTCESSFWNGILFSYTNTTMSLRRKTFTISEPVHFIWWVIFPCSITLQHNAFSFFYKLWSSNLNFWKKNKTSFI